MTWEEWDKKIEEYTKKIEELIKKSQNQQIDL
nr:Chain B, HIV-1 fusion inhibitor MT-WQ-IDL [Human immunodeficiency virus 1]5H0N_D Chain D, HIV-1 fusion inhibitor MT-WQ-IDL [Human immunodeficiency virus 1]5H0N_F Chain F, HIV-1 fusion inhibitor MT-WQ-IDL [Human immunodeficiency virus 1]5H0N_H Chain H, HIV-1 fusion inhibitor MT-WQ-IDL [Human immunodeficiency virus 1]5H0N_J Chain J, HIV-1 fusion inhibitor MT-WQ-IDL [Human immunodeficiency virus 1]5H0N_L Chain L, HIV-1 fusion inhibitor MT-WQ-IDL [Human immunodeficiency virus 1]